ncbi:hypothetical Protein YC6258_01975 [Gynuella sunshinyii YC6258]|uniref:Uncharacterized protein n=1 Tax=Gynuella sunshinyii YC6258 TaxID=1445510 RepID=A0A0C5VUC9_9GAMM|nr:hypothetical Protein YC6258_01975 [Gynuella sunshinyii YC6258]
MLLILERKCFIAMNSGFDEIFGIERKYDESMLKIKRFSMTI